MRALRPCPGPGSPRERRGGLARSPALSLLLRDPLPLPLPSPVSQPCDPRPAPAVFQKMACHGEHTYLFAQAMMSVLAQEEQGGSAVRRVAQEVQRFAQEK